MRVLRIAVAVVLLLSLVSPVAAQDEGAPSFFSVTSDRTYHAGREN